MKACVICAVVPKDNLMETRGNGALDKNEVDQHGSLEAAFGTSTYTGGCTFPMACR
jgi:hypothetical protein